MTSTALRSGPPRRAVLVGGIGVRSAFGAGLAALTDGVLAGRPAFAPVERFGTAGRRADHAAAGPGSPGWPTSWSRCSPRPAHSPARPGPAPPTGPRNC
ncbi:hypothetical protein [Kitasatospora sp. NA04385]|uniref:hypothetical protein n=1 Tax=Kitasatospora sp. NA04385 TaxID=2742135 RepID=UPI0026E103AC|nr:hypothetical protein [Kitasatospora sp. NA04385]